MRLKKTLLMSLLICLTIFTINAKVSLAGTEYELYSINNDSHLGIKGDFKMPVVDPDYDENDHPYNKINFKQWLQVNSNSDWFEKKKKKGNLADGTSNSIYHDGFFKSKKVNGVYTCDKLIRNFNTGTTYTFTIVDYYGKKIYDIYIGTKYFGSFADNVSPASGGTHDMGFEVTSNAQSNQSIGNTKINNPKYYVIDKDDYDNDNNTTERIWIPWSNLSPNRTHDAPCNISASYDSSTNKITFN